jgi:hypothetical protein
VFNTLLLSNTRSINIIDLEFRGKGKQQQLSFKSILLIVLTRSTLVWSFEGTERWDEKKEAGWKERLEDWKSKQGFLGADPEDVDPDMSL